MRSATAWRHQNQSRSGCGRESNDETIYVLPCARCAFLFPVAAGCRARTACGTVEAHPGGVVAVVVRTYAPRPIRQGQICLTVVLRGTDASPFEHIESALVYSVQADAWQNAAIDSADPSDPILVRFASPSASINAADGPLMAVFMRLRKDVAPGSEYEINVDFANTIVLDSLGQPIQIRPRDGRLRIKQPGAPVEAAASAEWLRPGLALLSLETEEVRPLSSGQIGLRFPMRAFPQQPKVFVDWRYGAANLDVTWLPGLVIVAFDSPDNSLNTLPGDIISIVAEAGPLAPQARLPITLDPSLTFLRDDQGNDLALFIENDVLEIE